jgi:LemA protein
MKLIHKAGIAALLVAFAVGLSGCSYNTFVSQEEAIKTQWAQVENQLQRRNDLIPNLVETVKGTAQQEKDVFGQIAESRAKLSGAQTPEQRIQAANEQSTAPLDSSSRIIRPEINAPFNRLMDELAGTENRLAVERMRCVRAGAGAKRLATEVPVERHRRHLRLHEHPLFNAPPEAEPKLQGQLGKAVLADTRMPVDTLLPEFDHEIHHARCSSACPTIIDWKPHAKSYAVGQLAQHVSRSRWGTMTLSEAELDLAQHPPLSPLPTIADVRALFETNAARARAALVGKSDAELKAQWSLKRDGHVIFSMPKHAVWRSFVISHVIHHRAQLGVYLRLLDVPVPSTYGPSADEGGF